MTTHRAGWRALAVTAVLGLAVSALLNASRPVQLRIDGENVVSDVAPVTEGHEVFVPLRAVADALGADTRFDPKSGQIEVIRGDEQLNLRMGARGAALDGAKMTLQKAPFRVRGRIMIGLHAISRAFSVKTHYDARTARIDVDTPGVIEGSLQDSSENNTP